MDRYPQLVSYIIARTGVECVDRYPQLVSYIIARTEV